MFGLGTQELLVILVIAFFIFGGKKLPELMRGLGKGIREFKDATNFDDIKNDINNIKSEITDTKRDITRPKTKSSNKNKTTDKSA